MLPKNKKPATSCDLPVSGLLKSDLWLSQISRIADTRASHGPDNNKRTAGSFWSGCSYPYAYPNLRTTAPSTLDLAGGEKIREFEQIFEIGAAPGCKA
jgi:hypothetical protein